MIAFPRSRALLLIPVLALVCVLFAASFSGSIHAAPAARSAPPNPQLVREGLAVFTNTPQYTSQWTGSTLSCTDCHLMAGTENDASPLFNIAAHFPSFSKRAGHRIDLQERIQECFVRSENGKPLPLNSLQMKALVAYLTSLHAPAGQKPAQALVKLPALAGNVSRGQALYGLQCSSCHQSNGAGLPGAYPAIWGNNSFNSGASMARVPMLAAWIKHNMPQNRPGTLTPQQAYDIAAYIDSHPRPKFNPAYKKY